jgi:hypothetical protein
MVPILRVSLQVSLHPTRNFREYALILTVLGVKNGLTKSAPEQINSHDTASVGRAKTPDHEQGMNATLITRCCY